jgi:S1-C subfamily serine protease
METKMKYVLIGLSFLTITFNSFALIPAEVYSKSVTAVLFLETDKGTENGGLGTGFFIGNEGLVLTNHHMVEGISTLVGTSYNRNKYTGFTLLYADRDSDIAVLKVDRIQENDTFLDLEKAEKITLIGDSISWIGHPAGNKFSFSVGNISNIKINGYVETLQYNGVAFGGSSGGPLLSDEGNVIGIHHASDRIVNGIRYGSSKNNIAQAIEIAKNKYTNYFKGNTSIAKNESSETKNSMDSNFEEPKNDLASLIGELKAYTPPSEVRLGSR